MPYRPVLVLKLICLPDSSILRPFICPYVSSVECQVNFLPNINYPAAKENHCKCILHVMLCFTCGKSKRYYELQMWNDEEYKLVGVSPGKLMQKPTVVNTSAETSMSVGEVHISLHNKITQPRKKYNKVPESHVIKVALVLLNI